MSKEDHPRSKYNCVGKYDKDGIESESKSRMLFRFLMRL
jgi:hypothetical protein